MTKMKKIFRSFYFFRFNEYTEGENEIGTVRVAMVLKKKKERKNYQPTIDFGIK